MPSSKWRVGDHVEVESVREIGFENSKWPAVVKKVHPTKGDVTVEYQCLKWDATVEKRPTIEKNELWRVRPKMPRDVDDGLTLQITERPLGSAVDLLRMKDDCWWHSGYVHEAYDDRVMVFFPATNETYVVYPSNGGKPSYPFIRSSYDWTAAAGWQRRVPQCYAGAKNLRRQTAQAPQAEPRGKARSSDGEQPRTVATAVQEAGRSDSLPQAAAEGPVAARATPVPARAGVPTPSQAGAAPAAGTGKETPPARPANSSGVAKREAATTASPVGSAEGGEGAKRKQWDDAEAAAVAASLRQHGLNWRKIEAALPGRTLGSIKQYVRRNRHSGPYHFQRCIDLYEAQDKQDGAPSGAPSIPAATSPAAAAKPAATEPTPSAASRAPPTRPPPTAAAQAGASPPAKAPAGAAVPAEPHATLPAKAPAAAAVPAKPHAALPAKAPAKAPAAAAAPAKPHSAVPAKAPAAAAVPVKPHAALPAKAPAKAPAAAAAPAKPHGAVPAKAPAGAAVPEKPHAALPAMAPTAAAVPAKAHAALPAKAPAMASAAAGVPAKLHAALPAKASAAAAALAEPHAALPAKAPAAAAAPTEPRPPASSGSFVAAAAVPALPLPAAAPKCAAAPARRKSPLRLDKQTFDALKRQQTGQGGNDMFGGAPAPKPAAAAAGVKRKAAASQHGAAARPATDGADGTGMSRRQEFEQRMSRGAAQWSDEEDEGGRRAADGSLQAPGASGAAAGLGGRASTSKVAPQLPLQRISAVRPEHPAAAPVGGAGRGRQPGWGLAPGRRSRTPSPSSSSSSDRGDRPAPAPAAAPGTHPAPSWVKGAGAAPWAAAPPTARATAAVLAAEAGGALPAAKPPAVAPLAPNKPRGATGVQRKAAPGKAVAPTTAAARASTSGREQEARGGRAAGNGGEGKAVAGRAAAQSKQPGALTPRAGPAVSAKLAPEGSSAAAAGPRQAQGAGGAESRGGAAGGDAAAPHGSQVPLNARAAAGILKRAGAASHKRNAAVGVGEAHGQPAKRPRLAFHAPANDARTKTAVRPPGALPGDAAAGPTKRQQHDQTRPRKVVIDNLGGGLTQRRLEALLQPHLPRWLDLRLQWVELGEGGAYRGGWACVEFSAPDDAERALCKLHDLYLQTPASPLPRPILAHYPRWEPYPWGSRAALPGHVELLLPGYQRAAAGARNGRGSHTFAHHFAQSNHMEHDWALQWRHLDACIAAAKAKMRSGHAEALAHAMRQYCKEVGHVRAQPAPAPALRQATCYVWLKGVQLQQPDRGDERQRERGGSQGQPAAARFFEQFVDNPQVQLLLNPVTQRPYGHALLQLTCPHHAQLVVQNLQDMVLLYGGMPRQVEGSVAMAGPPAGSQQVYNVALAKVFGGDDGDTASEDKWQVRVVDAGSEAREVLAAEERCALRLRALLREQQDAEAVMAALAVQRRAELHQEHAAMVQAEVEKLVMLYNINSAREVAERRRQQGVRYDPQYVKREPWAGMGLEARPGHLAREQRELYSVGNAQLGGTLMPPAVRPGGFTLGGGGGGKRSRQDKRAGGRGMRHMQVGDRGGGRKSGQRTAGR